jgi:hypothetical protein
LPKPRPGEAGHPVLHDAGESLRRLPEDGDDGKHLGVQVPQFSGSERQFVPVIMTGP